MKIPIRLLFILIAGLLVACSSDEPVQKVEKPGQEPEEPGQEPEEPREEPERDTFYPFEFDYSGIDLRAELYYQSPDLINYYDYYGEIPAEGGSFRISHGYNFYRNSKNDKYSILKLSINGEYIKGNHVNYFYVPSDGIEFCGEWGSVVTQFEDRKTITTFTLEKNETGNPRNFHIYLLYITFTGDIYLTQESL